MYYELELSNGFARFRAEDFHAWVKSIGESVSASPKDRTTQLQAWRDHVAKTTNADYVTVDDWEMIKG